MSEELQMSKIKWFIPITISILAAVSLITLKSIGPELILRQLLYFSIGSLIFFGVSKFKFSQIVRFSPWLFGVLNLVLVLLLLVGTVTRSTARWIELFGGFKLQPSQFLPLVLVLVIIKYWSRFKLFQFKGLLLLLLLIMLPAGLVFLQPDLGTSLVVVFSSLPVLLLAPVKWKHIGVVILIFVLLGGVGWLFLMRPYQKTRILSFFSSQTVSLDAEYHARQALIAVGSGEFYGRGLGAGVQSHLRFLPERQTDFVFASIAEEWGFIGSGLIVLLYGVLLSVLLRTAIISDNISHQLFLVSLLTLLLLHITVNIGMNIGLLPITGLTLPFISFGGSSIISFLISLGIAFNILGQQSYQKYKSVR
jgi:rod shape determining protein RodA